jgi:hypothetical protein
LCHFGFSDFTARIRRCTEHLAKLANGFRPGQIAGLVDTLSDCLNPDGTYRRGPHPGPCPAQGQSTPPGAIAAPELCNPADDNPVVDGPPSEQTAQRDTHSATQRNHDGLNAALRAALASGKLGQHNGLPATNIVSTTLTAVGIRGRHSGHRRGARLAMSAVIRLARHAHHYLAIFDNGKAIALYHTKRLASPRQRIVLYAKDRVRFAK